MKCPKCKHDVPDKAVFCNECGNKLEVICPSCQTSNPPGSKFCIKCGHELRVSDKTPFVDYSQPQSYTPRFLADKILTTRSAIEGERKLVTVFFADVAGYTALSEKLDPEEVHGIMDGCFTILMDEIHRFEGTINQFTGDGVMALFGAPLAHEDHAQRACHAALSIQNSLSAYGDKVKADTGIEFKMRIGLNSGHVIVGSIGDDLRMDYTAVGDTTNLASRMENLANPGSVTVSAHTHRLIKDYFELEFLGQVEIKGKEEKQEAWELIKSGKVTTRIGVSVSKGLTRFVGRQNSMANLNEAFEKAGAGSGQVVGIVGEAGVGKSRLLLEFVNQLPPGRYSALEGQCLHYGSSIPYLPLLDIIKSFFDITEGDREFVVKRNIVDKLLALDSKLDSDISPVLELLSIKAEDDAYTNLDPQTKKDKTFEALRNILIRQSRERPVVLIIEDLHWIDNTTQEFTNYLIDWIPGSRILLLLLYRPEYTHQWGSKSFYTKIGLDQLGPEFSLELIRAILQESDAAEDLKELIVSKAAGNPLFMEEFTQNLVENGTIEKQGEMYIVSKNISGIEVPDTVQGIIAARMDRLEDNLKRTMQAASVIGRDFAFRILQTITDQRAELKSALLNLQGLEFIYEKQLFPELEYIFKHALIQEVAYNSLLQQRRKGIHENIGRAIEDIYSDQLEEFYEVLAYHYSKSENLKKSSEYLKLSGQKAYVNYSMTETFHFLTEAIATLKKMESDDETVKTLIEVHISLGSALLYSSFFDEGLEIMREGEKLSKLIGDEKKLARIYSLTVLFYAFKGESKLAEEYAEKCNEVAEKSQDAEMLVWAARSFSFSYFFQGKFIDLIRMNSKVIDLLESTGKENQLIEGLYLPYSEFCGMTGYSLGKIGEFKEAEAYCEKGLTVSSEIGLPVPNAESEIQYCNFLADKGDGRRCVEHSINLINNAEYNPLQLAFGLCLSGAGYHLMGEISTAREKIKEAIKIMEERGRALSLCDFYRTLGAVQYDSDDLKDALRCAEKALDLSQAVNEVPIEGMSSLLLGRILGKIDQSSMDEAEESILKGIKICEDLKMKPYSSQGHLFLGELYAKTDRKKGARENLAKAEVAFQEMDMDYWLARTYAVYAELHKKEGDLSKASENLTRAIDIMKELEADGWVERYELARDRLKAEGERI